MAVSRRVLLLKRIFAPQVSGATSRCGTDPFIFAEKAQMVTLAPELDEALAATRLFRLHGVVTAYLAAKPLKEWWVRQGLNL